MSINEFNGLTDDEVRINREKFGANVIGIESKNPFWKILKGIITEPLFIILVCTVAIYLLIGEASEAVIMLVALFFVAGISLYQESRSQSAVDELKRISAPLSKVIRNKSISEVPTEEIVMSDLIYIEDGSLIPADATILEAYDFSVNESILTGESLPVFKEATGPGNVIFQGTIATTGYCIACVSALGKQTKFGKIGQSLEDIETSKTPLQLQIRRFVRSMVLVGTIAFVIVWAINYYLTKDILLGLLKGLTLAMSVLPEEIPVAFSTFMAMGAYHLYRKRVIARSPHTVETLGAATVICVDKTGTITENVMQLSAIYDFSSDEILDLKVSVPESNKILEYSMWASEINPFDPMEKSIHKFYKANSKVDKREEFKLIQEYPLSGSPPIMTHVFSNGNDHIVASKGSVEGLLKLTKLTDKQKSTIKERVDTLAKKGNRVLGVGASKKDIHLLPVSQHDLEFEFLGLIAFYDPPKKNIEQVIQQFYDAGIEVKMLTGDYPETSYAIADQVHLKKGMEGMSGNEVMELSEKKLREKVGAINVFARMFPEAKLKVIEALKANGEIVAMTGDGVNDGLALKASHIGIAMGSRGSEIAKKASSLILMDDDLSLMVDAIALGRRIYENLKKAIQYIISVHIPIILIVTIPLLFFWKYSNFFSPVHVIFLELIMGPTCSVIFENEPLEADSMKRKPHKMSTQFFSFRELFLSIVQGLIITAACLGLGYYFILKNSDETMVRTIIYTTLIFSNIFLTLVNRSFYFSIFTTLRYKNYLIPVILTISLVILFLSIYVEPIRGVFQFSRLDLQDLLLCFVVSIAGVLWIEVYKIYRRRTSYVLKNRNPNKIK
jgi:Ca2+-transporting ATPase